jgi:hypothetical protein
MKFVLHRHITENEHYDLMIDTGPDLATWRIPVDGLCDLSLGTVVPCERINAHRRAYLDTTEPIDCSKGSVVLSDSGLYIIEKTEGDVLTVILSGSLLAGKFIITANSIQRIEDTIPA